MTRTSDKHRQYAWEKYIAHLEIDFSSSKIITSSMLNTVTALAICKVMRLCYSMTSRNKHNIAPFLRYLTSQVCLQLVWLCIVYNASRQSYADSPVSSLSSSLLDGFLFGLLLLGLRIQFLLYLCHFLFLLPFSLLFTNWKNNQYR